MSFDLTIYTTKKINLSVSSLKEFAIIELNNEYILENTNWYLTIYPPSECISNHLPKQLKRLKRGIKYSYEISIQPISFKDENEIIESLLEVLTTEFNGLIHDHQGDVYYDFNEILEFVIEENTYLETVCFAWYFNDLTKIKNKNFCKFIDILENYIPYCLPERYSNFDFEYLNYKKTGREKFENFVIENSSTEGINIHIIPKISSIHFEFPSKPDNQNNFWCWAIKINIPVKILSKTNYYENSLKSWKEIINLLDPFYSEIRRIKELNFINGVATRTYGHKSPPIQNPIYSGFWNGIPKKLDLAVSMNSSLTKYWQKSIDLLIQLNQNQLYIEIDNIDSNETISKRLGRVPRKLRQRSFNKNPRIIPT